MRLFMFSFCFLLSSSFLLAQEQITFVDNHDRRIYKYGQFYMSSDKLRYLSEEKDGTLIIAEYNGTEFDTIMRYVNPNSIPWFNNSIIHNVGSEFMDPYPAQLLFIDFHDLEVQTVPYMYQKEWTPTVVGDYIFNADFSNGCRVLVFRNRENVITDRVSICDSEYRVIHNSLVLILEGDLFSGNRLKIYDPVTKTTKSIEVGGQFNDYNQFVKTHDYQIDLRLPLVSNANKVYYVSVDGELQWLFNSDSEVEWKSVRQRDSLVLFNYQKSSGLTDLYYFNLNSFSLDSIPSLAEPLDNITLLNPLSHLVATSYGNAVNPNKNYLYDINQDTMILLDDFDSDCLLDSAYFYTSKDSLYKVSLETKKIEFLGLLSVVPYEGIENLLVLEYDNQLFVQADFDLYKYSSQSGLVPLHQFTYDISGFNNIAGNVTYSGDDIYITEVNDSARHELYRSSYHYNGADILPLDDIQLLSPSRKNSGFLMDGNFNLSSRINNKIWAYSDGYTGVLEGRNFRSIINAIPIESNYTWGAKANKLFHTENEKYIFFESENFERWIINTDTEEAFQFTAFDSLGLYSNYETYGSKLFLTTHDPGKYNKFTWMLDLESKELIELGEFSIRSISQLENGSILALGAYPYPSDDNILISIQDDGSFLDLHQLLNDYMPSQIRLKGDNNPFFVSGYSGSKKKIILTDGTIVGTEEIIETDNGSLGMKYFHNNRLYIQNNEDVFYYEVNSKELVDLEIESQLSVGRMFAVGSSLFVYVQDEEKCENYMAKIDDDVLTKIFETEALGRVETDFVFDTLLDPPAKLALFNIEPFGNELYVIYEDGTLRQLTDLNKGPLNIFETYTFEHFPYYNSFDPFLHQGFLYFVGLTQEYGRQLWRIPADFEKISSIPKFSDNDPTPPYISLYPNPAQDFLNIELSMRFPPVKSFRIVNTLGQEIKMSSSLSNNFQIDIESYHEGLYYLIIETANDRFIKSFYRSN